MQTALFDNRSLKKMILPLLFDQLLMSLVGITNVLMISSVGEAAVSAVSLVETINMLITTIFTGLATGGAIICAQYVGQKKLHLAARSATQLLTVIVSLSLLFLLIFWIFKKALLHLLFGSVDAEVMENAFSYFSITMLSYPFLALYTCCGAIFRSRANTRLPMYVSLLMNGINITGNYFLLFVFHFQIEGVAYPTVVARMIASLLLFYLTLSRKHRPFPSIPPLYETRNVLLQCMGKLKPDLAIIRRILSVGIPAGLELSIFQIGKILVLGLIASIGTTAITSNAIANTVNTFQALPQDAIGLALITIVGQCIGAGEKAQAVANTKKLIKTTYIAMWSLNVIVLLFIPLITRMFNLSPETTEITSRLIQFNCLFAFTAWPLSFALPNALRGASDVTFTLSVSMFSMWVFRVALSYLCIRFFNASIYLLYCCFAVDWIFRALMFTLRFKSKKWLTRLP